jgi:hypothetical protein
VFLVDSIGELAALYSLATVAFVGGSLVPRGGHNILEPALYGVPVVTGNHYENFRDIVNYFRERNAVRVVGAAELPLDIAEAAPAIFSGGITHADGTAVNSANPARAGETLVIYATGLGSVDHAVEPGDVAPDAPLCRALAQVTVQIGGATVTPDFAGLTPRFVGVYQVNVKVPLDLAAAGPAGLPLRLAAKGSFSNSTSLQVANR